MSEKELAESGGGHAACEVGVVEIVAGEVSELFGDVIVFVAGEGWSGGGVGNLFAMLGDVVECFDCVGKRELRLVLEVFASDVGINRRCRCRAEPDARDARCAILRRRGRARVR